MDQGLTDAEVLRVLRTRVRVLEAGIDDYLDALLALGTPVAAAWDALDHAMRHAGVDPGIEGDSVAAFVAAYRDSLPKRKAAVDALLAAVTEDFQTAVLTSEDMTDDQRAKWVALCEAEQEEQGQ